MSSSPAKLQLGRAPLCLAVLLTLCLRPSAASAADTAELNLDATRAPYRVELVKSMNFGQEDPSKTSYLIADLEGDGGPELITGELTRLLGWDFEDSYIKPRFQLNLEPGWRLHHHSGAVLGVTTDLDGDRISELHVTTVALDGSSWHFMTIDLATNEIVRETVLPIGEDRRADGVWDGSYMPVGVLADADGNGSPGIVLLRNAAYDASLRGLVVVDPRDGHILWEWTCGPNPDTRNVVISDLDGDGFPEIALFGNSPDNLNGVEVNGASDDRAFLFVISATGTELWREELGGPFCGGTVEAADLNGDGRSELITFTAVGQTGVTNTLIIWDFATRSRIATQRQEAGFLGLAVVDGPEPGSHLLVTGSNEGYLTSYRFADGRLSRENRRMINQPACRVVGALDVLPEPGREILVDIGPGLDFAVLRPDLETLAVFNSEIPGARDMPLIWERTPGNRSLVVGDAKAYFVLDFVRNPHSLPVWALVAAGVVLAIVLLAGTFRLGRARGRRDLTRMVPVDARSAQIADRETLFRIWRQLDDIDHERLLAANRGVTRLVWLLEAYAADLGASDGLRVRIGHLMTEFDESVQPRLLEILHLATTENFEVQTVTETGQALQRLGNLLGALNVDTLTVESVRASHAGMKEELARVEAGFLHLHEALRAYFSTDPVRMVQGMLLLRDVEFNRAGVESRLLGVANVTDPVCLVDGTSLRFVLDNLLDNAVRAMADTAKRVLTVRVSRAESEVTIEVTDTGPGIADDVRDRIFNGRVSSRPGGGSGLFRSREMLQKWRGEILTRASESGQGTTFVVKLRAAQKLPGGDVEARTLIGRG